MLVMLFGPIGNDRISLRRCGTNELRSDALVVHIDPQIGHKAGRCLAATIGDGAFTNCDGLTATDNRREQRRRDSTQRTQRSGRFAHVVHESGLNDGIDQKNRRVRWLMLPFM